MQKMTSQSPRPVLHLKRAAGSTAALCARSEQVLSVRRVLIVLLVLSQERICLRTPTLWSQLSKAATTRILTHKSPSVFGRLKDWHHIWGCGLEDFLYSNWIVLFFGRFVSLSLKEITTVKPAEEANQRGLPGKYVEILESYRLICWDNRMTG